MGLAFGLVFGLASGLVVGLASGLVVGLVVGLASGLASGLVFGLVVALVGGLVDGNHHAWLACKAALFHLAATRQLPLALMPFLDDMHRLGLLRAVGPLYQFRHAEIQDRLYSQHQDHTDRPAAAAEPRCE